jgi:hypothetical protein
MDVPQDRTVRRFVRWLKDKVENRRGRDGDTDPWWVTLLLDVGRPLVAVLILTMCAPGEHYLAVQAGWSERLAWGMPGTLTAYAGIAAVVATKRPKGAHGRKTAIWGAVVSVALAMAAQPVAHLYGRTGLTPQMISLTVTMGLIPAAVFGHLLHMGASGPKPVRDEKDRTVPLPRTTGTPDSVPVRPEAPVPDSVPVRPDTGTRPRPGHEYDGVRVQDPFVPDRTAPALIRDKQNLSVLALSLASAGQDKDTIKDRLRTEFPDAKPDSVRKATERALDKVSRAS